MLVPLEEYLRTTYRPDRDYVDGEVLERNLGERDHSELQREFILYLCARAKRWGIHVFPEQRVQVSSPKIPYSRYLRRIRSRAAGTDLPRAALHLH